MPGVVRMDAAIDVPDRVPVPALLLSGLSAARAGGYQSNAAWAGTRRSAHDQIAGPAQPPDSGSAPDTGSAPRPGSAPHTGSAPRPGSAPRHRLSPRTPAQPPHTGSVPDTRSGMTGPGRGRNRKGQHQMIMNSYRRQPQSRRSLLDHPGWRRLRAASRVPDDHFAANVGNAVACDSIAARPARRIASSGAGLSVISVTWPAA